jgi:hypothetical protein
VAGPTDPRTVVPGADPAKSSPRIWKRGFKMPVLAIIKDEICFGVVKARSGKASDAAKAVKYA